MKPTTQGTRLLEQSKRVVQMAGSERKVGQWTGRRFDRPSCATTMRRGSGEFMGEVHEQGNRNEHAFPAAIAQIRICRARRTTS
jgi:hypothetical protein